MSDLRQERRRGMDALDLITTLLQRRRAAHPTKGSYEAAELQFWFSTPSSTDGIDQLFWLDSEGQPEAAACMFDFVGGPSLVHDSVTFCPFVLPDATPGFLAEVVVGGLDLARQQGFTSVEVEVANTDVAMQAVMNSLGFILKEANVLVECWLSADARSAVSPLHDGYRLVSRDEAPERPHYLASPTKDFSTDRLDELSLYRPELDLTIVDEADNDVGHCLFWLDPVTATGVVEPMRVDEAHQKKGLARHLLTVGIDMLARSGAQRISICYEPDNPATGHLNHSIGFVDTHHSDLYSGPTEVLESGHGS